MPDHEAVDRAHRHAKPSSDLGMGQPLDPIEQKGITAERRQIGEGVMQPGKLHRGARGGFWIGQRHRIGAEIEGLASMTQTDLGLAREIHRQIAAVRKR